MVINGEPGIGPGVRLASKDSIPCTYGERVVVVRLFLLACPNVFPNIGGSMYSSATEDIKEARGEPGVLLRFVMFASAWV